MATFESAITDSKKLLAKPSNDELLELYGISFPLPTGNLSNVCQHSSKSEVEKTSLQHLLLELLT